MTPPAPARDTNDEVPTQISAYSTCPDKTVFTERTNPDGWIATDLTIEVTP